jgi:hypothetical protein
MCPDFRFQHRIIFKVAAVLLLCNLISRFRKICPLQICKEYLDSKLIQEISFCLLFAQYLIDFKTQKDFVLLQICKEMYCGLKSHPQIFYLLLCNMYLISRLRKIRGLQICEEYLGLKINPIFFHLKFCYLISRGRKILCFADMQGMPWNSKLIQESF